MNTMRMILLTVCILSPNVRPVTRLVATAFAPPQHVRIAARGVGSISRRSLPFDSPVSSREHTPFARSTSYFSSTLASRTHRDGPSSKLIQLCSTAPNNDNIAPDDRDVSEIVWNNVEEVDPYSDQAKNNLANFYTKNGIDTDVDVAHSSLLRLSEQVLSWNQRLNLISRKDCTVSVVYHRHVLPSVALLPLILEAQQNNDKQMNIVDVGTGGGFPGLPLALLLPDVQFTLVDSTQKKLVAVSEMAAELDVTNIRIHWGRVEEMYCGEKGEREHRGRYDVVLGRSVTTLPRFCGWVSDLLKSTHGNVEDEDKEGRLIYIIGGELDDLVESRIAQDISLDQILQRAEGTSDKRALTFHAQDVEEIANESGEKQKITRSGPGKKNKKGENNRGGKKMAKGAWSEKQNDVKKQRGYEGFKRYEF